MIKKMSLIFLMLFCLLLVGCEYIHVHEYVDGVCSCGDTQKVTYTVTFKDYDGKVLKEQEVEKNASATPPTDPTREGYEFTGWSDDYTNVVSDLVIVAQYKEKQQEHTHEYIDGVCSCGDTQMVTYTVTFKDYDGKVLKEQEVEKNASAIPPTDPTREGYEFTGWSDDYTNVVSDLVIVAQYKEKQQEHTHEYIDGVCSCGDTRLKDTKDELTTYINSLGKIEKNIKLPNSNEKYETTISYSSSNTDVLSDTGVFDRPYKPTTVTLTATISYKESSITETYKFDIDGYKKLENIASSYVYTNYDKVTDEFFETMDIIYCAFMLIDVDGGFTGKDGAGNSISSTNARYKEYMKTHILPKAHAKGDWVVISVGGGGSAYDKAFEAICDDAAKIDKLVKNIIALINECGFDGVDIDWEIPDTATDFTKLMEKLYPAVKANNPNHIVTAAIGGGKWQPPKYDLKNTGKYLDFINVMTYSMTSESGYHHTALYKSSTYFDPTNKVAKTLVSCSIEESVKIYNDTYGIPSSKLIVGGAFYASKQTRTSKDATWKSSGSISYTNIKNTYLKDPNYTYYYDTNCQAPYLLSKDGLTFISYDDPTSIKAKCEYILKNDLAGFMYWQNGQDTTGDLVKAIKEGLKK